MDAKTLKAADTVKPKTFAGEAEGDAATTSSTQILNSTVNNRGEGVADQ